MLSIQQAVPADGWALLGTISYPLFADADTGIYPHTISQYHEG